MDRSSVTKLDQLRPLLEAGLLDAKTIAGLVRTAPWIIGRGLSLAIPSMAHARARAGEVALIDDKGSVTWGELDERSNRAAHLLRDLGASVNRPVALVLRNGREVAELLLAGQKIGISVAPLNTWATEREVGELIGSADPAVVVCDERHLDQVVPAISSTVEVLVVGKTLRGFGRYEDELQRHPSFGTSPFPVRRGSPRVVIYTSGTTGRPRGAGRSPASAGVVSFAHLLARLPYRRSDVIVCPAPLFHSFGLGTFAFGLVLGATVVLPDRFDPRNCLALVERHRATALSLVPVMLRRIVELRPEERAFDLSSLRIVLVSGSALSTDLRERAVGVFGDVLYDLYGSTEAGWISIATPEDMKAKPDSVGRPVAGVQVVVMSASGQELGPYERGEICIDSDVKFEGYVTDDEPAADNSGLVALGDIGYLDDEGFLYVEARKDDMVIVGGENIYPAEVEKVIEKLPGVVEAAVVGAPDAEYGQVLVAHVEGDVTAEEVSSWCGGRLASFKVPRKIVVGPLPRTGTGKVLKRALAGEL